MKRSQSATPSNVNDIRQVSVVTRSAPAVASADSMAASDAKGPSGPALRGSSGGIHGRSSPSNSRHRALCAPNVVTPIRPPGQSSATQRANAARGSGRNSTSEEATTSNEAAGRSGADASPTATSAPVPAREGRPPRTHPPASSTRVTLTYSDGSTGSRAVAWDAASLAAVDVTTPGRYEVTDAVRAPQYPTPFADERADPSIFPFDWNGRRIFLMIATEDLNLNPIDPANGPHMPIRAAERIEDLSDDAAWIRLNYPIQKSGPFNGQWQLGTGHGMWSHDEDDNPLYVFHARADHRGLSGRDTFVCRVHFAADGMPVFDMTADEEVAPSLRAVTVAVVVR